MVAVPVDTPDTTPLVVPIVAIPVAELVHAPPVVASDSVMLPPTHKDEGPVIAAGFGFTAIGTILLQPVVRV
jgi:hypothetical protein